MNAGSSLAHWFLVSIRLAIIAMRNVVSDQLPLQLMHICSILALISQDNIFVVNNNLVLTFVIMDITVSKS